MDARRRARGGVRRPAGAGFALIGLAVLALAAVAALVALAGAILASPYLLVHTLRRRLAERALPSIEGLTVKETVAPGA